MYRITIICLTITLISLVICFDTNRGLAANTKSITTTTPTSTAESKSSIDNSKSSTDNSKSSIDNSKSMADDAKSMTSREDDSNSDADLINVMMMCNDSFRIEMSYLVSLNESGSFPDETDKTPKCYLRCILQTMNIASMEDGAIDAERAAVVFAGTRNGEPMENILEMATLCAQGRDETCKCEMAYNFLKCLFSMEIEKYSKS